MAEADVVKLDSGEDEIMSSESSMPTPQEQEAAIKKKYGGLMPRKLPLISKDPDRTYFDSADWALGKGELPSQKPKTLVQMLRPKLQPTPHQPLPARRASYGNMEGENGTGEESVDDNGASHVHEEAS